jgi:hypothetical protein
MFGSSRHRDRMVEDVLSVLNRAHLLQGNGQSGRMYVHDIGRQIAYMHGESSIARRVALLRGKSWAPSGVRYMADAHVALAALERSGRVRSGWDLPPADRGPRRRWYEAADQLIEWPGPQ